MTGCPARDNARLMIRELGLPLTVDQFVVQLQFECAKIFARRVPLMPGAARLVQHLHSSGIPIAVATSTKRANFDLKSAHHRDLFSLFDHIVISPEDAEVKRGKPDPAIFRVCASRFRVPPKDAVSVLVFEDSIAGVQAANAAGMRSVWVPDPRSLSSVNCFLRLKSLEHFRPELVGLPPFK